MEEIEDIRKLQNPLSIKVYLRLLHQEISKNIAKELIVKEQYYIEKDFISQSENLRENINVLIFYKRLKNFDINKFFEINKEEFYTPDSVNFFNYFTKAVLFSSKNNYRFYRRIRYWIEDLKNISKGTYGSTYSAKVRGTEEDNRLFLLKFDKKGDKEVFLHEYFIGNFFANKLRKYCPNFSMVFGLIKCSLPESVFRFGRQYKKISCIVYEYINPAIIFGKFLEDCSAETFLSILLQLIFALRIGAEKMGFTHNDLHSGNVMIKKLEKETLIPYEYKGTKFYVYTEYLAVIIDYGLSRIEIKSKNFGPYGIPMNTLNSYEKCYPIKDIFSILLDSARITGNHLINDQCFQIADRIITGFFISGITEPKKYEDLMKKAWVYPFLPHLEGLQGLDKFIDWLFENFEQELDKIVFSKESVLKIRNKNRFLILDCDLSACPSLEEIYDEIYKRKSIDDIFYYYDIFQYNINVKPPKTVIQKTEEIIKYMFLEVKTELLSLEEEEAKTKLEIKKKNYKKMIEVYLKIKDLNETVKVLREFTKIKPEFIKKLTNLKTRINGILKKMYKKKINALVNEQTEEVKDLIIPSFIF
jgi:hypothetical protein